MPGPIGPSRLRVVVLAEDGSMRRSLERHLSASPLDVELVQTLSELESRAIHAERPAPEMIVLLPSPRGVAASRGVAALVARASTLIRKPPAPAPLRSESTDERQGATLASLVSTYALRRAFSPQQEKVLRLYLAGKNDKEIAELCACSPATVYEHWRRMAKKGGALHKADVIADFHRFLSHE